MLSFTGFQQTLTEKFLKGYDGPGGYVEIFQNPTPSEMAAFGQWATVPIDDDARMRDGSPFPSRARYFAGFVTPTDLYIFNRDRGMHAEVVHEIPDLARGSKIEWIPLYLYYWANTKSIALEIARYSAPSRVTSLSDDALFRKCRRTTPFKGFDLYNDFGDLIKP